MEKRRRIAQIPVIYKLTASNAQEYLSNVQAEWKEVIENRQQIR